MPLFQAKIGWKMPRKREYKNYRSVPFRSYTTNNRKFQKNSKNTLKIKKHLYGFLSCQNRFEKLRKGENKNYRSVSFLPDAKLKIPKK